MSKSQRTKGAAGERELCRLIEDVTGAPARRNLSQTREGGTDIALGDWRIEVKRRARIAGIYDWLGQAERACDGPRLTPVVCARADGKKWFAVLRIEDFLRILGNDL